jgi:hypothetical protein
MKTHETVFSSSKYEAVLNEIRAVQDLLEAARLSAAAADTLNHDV